MHLVWRKNPYLGHYWIYYQVYLHDDTVYAVCVLQCVCVCNFASCCLSSSSNPMYAPLNEPSDSCMYHWLQITSVRVVRRVFYGYLLWQAFPILYMLDCNMFLQHCKLSCWRFSISCTIVWSLKGSYRHCLSMCHAVLQWSYTGNIKPTVYYVFVATPWFILYI